MRGGAELGRPSGTLLRHGGGLDYATFWRLLSRPGSSLRTNMSRSSGMALRMLAVAAMLGWRWVPREWAPREVDRVRWALGCDEIENLERLLSHVELERMDQGYYNQLLDTGLEPGLSPPICRAGRRAA